MESTEKPLGSIIESAMTRLKADADAHAAERQSLGRRDYDLALANRLEQLHGAMGEGGHQAAGQMPPRPILPKAPAHTSQSATLLATAVFSAIAGAGLMWLVMGSNAAPQAFPAQATHLRLAPPAAILPAAVATTPLPAPAPTLAASTAQVPESPPPEAVKVAAKSLETEASELLEAWRMAWSNRDADTYLSYYSPDFVPTDGQTRDDWAAGRRKNLASRPSIQVDVKAVKIEKMADDRVRIDFLQDYAAGNYRENTQPKTLLLVRQGEVWRISGESQAAPSGGAAKRR